MQRVIPLEYFRLQQSIWYNVMSLQPIDDHLSTKRFEEFITKPTQHGFRRYFYSSSDDSEHFKSNRHVCVTSNVKDTSNEPTFRHITSSISITKDSEGNSMKNAQDMLKKLNVLICAHYGGGCNDNANNAQLELSATFAKVMEMVSSAGHEALLYVNGVKRRAIRFGDPFHIDNLVVMHCSLAAFGDVDKGDHEQAHHRQLLHSVFSLHSADPALSQRMLDTVMEGSRGGNTSFSDSEFENELGDRKFRMKAVKERQQR